MPAQCKKIVLSRFFNNNVELIANMCSLCYEECVDVRIIGVNLNFLKQTSNFEDTNFTNFKFLNSDCPVILDVERGDPGFSKEEIDKSLSCTEKINKIINTEEEVIAKLEEDFSKFKSNTFFYGFSVEEIRQSSDDHKQVVKIYERERYKIHKRVSLRAVHNIYNKRATKSIQRRNVKEEHIENQNKSKYFKIELNNSEDHLKNSQIYIKDCSNNVKVETCEHITEHFKALSSVKTETDTIDYESEYLANQFAFDSKKFKTETYLVPKKENREDEILDKKVPVWIPPRSPHNLIEEVLYHDPWALLVATIFLNRTSCMCARPYVFWFLKDNPDPFKVLEKYPGEFEKYFVNLGLQKTRSVQVWRMSHDFVYKNWNDVKDLYGIGEYGQNAFRMFCLGDFSVEPKDRFLRIYKAWYEKVEKKKSSF